MPAGFRTRETPITTAEVLNAISRYSVNRRPIPKGVDIIWLPLGKSGESPDFPGLFLDSLVDKPVDTGDNFKFSTGERRLFCNIMSTSFPAAVREKNLPESFRFPARFLFNLRS